MAELAAGSCIGSYRVLRRLGAGGMGVVYEVEHAQLGVRYALKVFPFEGQKMEFLRKRFFAEGKILARLSVPGVVRVYDMGVTDSFAWFTMDCVLGSDGEPHTLAGGAQAGDSPEDVFIDWYDEVRQALMGVHVAGVVHRDIKLENILVDSDGKAKLSDFGISRVRDETLRAEIALTRTMATGTPTDARIVLGTVAYMAPEMRSGGEATPATDYYALGVAFFRLLTGIWYEPGPHVFDLLAPFNKRWRVVLEALLAVDPEKRALLPFRVEHRRLPLGFLLGISVALLVAVGGYICRQNLQVAVAGEGFVPEEKPLGGVQLWEDGPYWAECNVGATKPEECGCYFWWGDTVGYRCEGGTYDSSSNRYTNVTWVSSQGTRMFESPFSWSRCPSISSDIAALQSAGYIDATTNLVVAYDAAVAHLGCPWRMPTLEEFRALKSKCTTIWTTRNGVNGRLVTGKGSYASKSIFLPAAGRGYGSDLDRIGSGGSYWSATPVSGSSNSTWYMNLNSGSFYWDNHSRSHGQPVRSVRGFAQ